MMSHFKSLSVCLVAALLLLAPAPLRAADDTKPIRVLFVGNSYTSVNNLPGMIQALANYAKQKRKLQTVALAPGGWTLQRHLEDEKSETPKMIAEGNWDYVAFQEQSQLPFMYPDKTIEYGEKLAALAKEAKATPLWYLTWSRENQTDKQDAISKTYHELAKRTESPLAPVGPAWQAAIKANPNLKLYNKDQSHPTAHGTYLAACVFYAKLYDNSPQGLPGKLTLEVDKKIRLLCDIPKADAELLQKVAWETVKPAK